MVPIITGQVRATPTSNAEREMTLEPGLRDAPVWWADSKMLGLNNLAFVCVASARTMQRKRQSGD